MVRGPALSGGGSHRPPSTSSRQPHTYLAPPSGPSSSGSCRSSGLQRPPSWCSAGCPRTAAPLSASAWPGKDTADAGRLLPGGGALWRLRLQVCPNMPEAFPAGDTPTPPLGPAKPYLPGTLAFGADLATYDSALRVAVISFFQNRYFSTRIFNCVKQKSAGRGDGEEVGLRALGPWPSLGSSRGCGRGSSWGDSRGSFCSNRGPPS